MTKNLWLKLLESQLCLDQDWGPRRLHTFFLLIIWIHAYRVVCPCWVLTEPNRVVHGHSRSGQSRLLLSFPPRPLTRVPLTNRRAGFGLVAGDLFAGLASSHESCAWHETNSPLSWSFRLICSQFSYCVLVSQACSMFLKELLVFFEEITIFRSSWYWLSCPLWSLNTSTQKL